MPQNNILMCSNFLYMSNMDAGSSDWGGCQDQSWHNDIILTSQVTQNPKIVTGLSKGYRERKEHMWLYKSNRIKNVWGRETGKYCKKSWWGQSGIRTSTSKERGKKSCIIWPTLQKIYKIIMIYHYQLTMFWLQLNWELYMVYMNTLMLGCTSKKPPFTRFIVSKMWVTSPVTNKIHENTR